MSETDAIHLRPCEDEDMDLLAAVYASTRAEEMAIVPWSEEQKQQFVAMQFQAQHSFYHQSWPDADYLIVMRGEEPIGRLYLDRRPQELHIIDITILPDHRGQGFGENLLKDILEEGRSKGLPVRMHVETNNPARRLYDRLGFREVHVQGIHHLIEWTPESEA